MATTNYFEQITAQLDKFDSIKQLKRQRSQVIKDIHTIAKKLTAIDDKLSQEQTFTQGQAQDLYLPLEVLDEVGTSEQQLQFFMEVIEKDERYSEISAVYLEELVALDIEILSLKNEPALVAA